MSGFQELYSDSCNQMKVYPAYEVDKKIEALTAEIEGCILAKRPL